MNAVRLRLVSAGVRCDPGSRQQIVMDRIKELVKWRVFWCYAPVFSKLSTGFVDNM